MASTTHVHVHMDGSPSILEVDPCADLNTEGGGSAVDAEQVWTSG